MALLIYVLFCEDMLPRLDAFGHNDGFYLRLGLIPFIWACLGSASAVSLGLQLLYTVGSTTGLPLGLGSTTAVGQMIRSPDCFYLISSLYCSRLKTYQEVSGK